MNAKKFITIMTAGFALFAMFFGAGNLVIPPYIGLKVGALSGVAFAGFFISDILLSFLAVVMVGFIGITFTDLGKRFPPLFVNALAFLIILTLGPLICVPRTGSTTYEVAVLPFFPQIEAFSPEVGKIGFGILYFGITLVLSLSKSKIVDIIGKILTPFLIASLTILIIVGTLNAPSGLKDTGYDFAQAFSFGFSKGYLTLDVLAGVIFSGLIISSVVQQGYKEEREKRQITILSGIIAAGCLTFIYGGLLYLGATSNLTHSDDISYIDILKHVAYSVLGDKGGLVISIAVAFACLTSAIAIVSAMGEIFENISKGRIPYKWGVWICSIMSFALAIMSVDQIIHYAGFILDFAYPITISLTLFVLIFGKTIRWNTPYIVGVTTSAVISGVFTMAKLLSLNNILAFKDKLPLASYQIEWFLPTVLAFAIAVLVDYKKLKNA